jgi:multiple antibiotic resistance protein
MNAGTVRFFFSALVTLGVVVDPFGAVPIFTALTAGFDAARRRAILRRAVANALGIALFFLLAGRAALAYLGVSVDAFAISGGILLFMTAVPMLFGQRAGLQAPEVGEEAGIGNDLSIFPLAIPLLSGPGAITTILLLAAQAGSDGWRMAALGLAIAAVFLAAWVVLWVGETVMARLGASGVHVVTRVMGILLASLAIQFVLNGVTAYYRSMAGH